MPKALRASSFSGKQNLHTDLPVWCKRVDAGGASRPTMSFKTPAQDVGRYAV